MYFLDDLSDPNAYDVYMRKPRRARHLSETGAH